MQIYRIKVWAPLTQSRWSVSKLTLLSSTIAALEWREKSPGTVSSSILPPLSVLCVTSFNGTNVLLVVLWTYCTTNTYVRAFLVWPWLMGRQRYIRLLCYSLPLLVYLLSTSSVPGLEQRLKDWYCVYILEATLPVPSLVLPCIELFMYGNKTFGHNRQFQQLQSRRLPRSLC